MSQKNLKYFLGLVLLFLIGCTFFIPTASSQDEQKLLIEVYDSNDWNESAGAIIFEGRSYDITVCTENDSIIMNVTITVLGRIYQTNYSEPFITIEAPLFEESDTVLITATKEGYQPGILELTVLKGELAIVTDQVVVDEDTQFQVTVTDQNNEPVEGASVYVTENASPIPTDQLGKAYVRAPEIKVLTSTTIQVIKSGYLPGYTTIRVENVETSFFNLTQAQFLQILPILLAIIVVVISILYVFLRQKKEATKALKNVRVDKPGEPSPHHNGSSQRSKIEPARYPEKKDVSSVNVEPRVEEIRIPVQAKKKETTIIPEKKEDENPKDDEEKHPDEWFKGQDYMRYKIDELTGKIDQQTDGKWFEGEQITKYKVDETLKKSLKKKKVDDDSVK